MLGCTQHTHCLRVHIMCNPCCPHKAASYLPAHAAQHGCSPPALGVALACPAGLAFDPLAGRTKGAWPLYYLRGLEAQVLAIAGSHLDALLLQVGGERAPCRRQQHPCTPLSPLSFVTPLSPLSFVATSRTCLCPAAPAALVQEKVRRSLDQLKGPAGASSVAGGSPVGGNSPRANSLRGGGSFSAALAADTRLEGPIPGGWGGWEGGADRVGEAWASRMLQLPCHACLKGPDQCLALGMQGRPGLLVPTHTPSHRLGIALTARPCPGTHPLQAPSLRVAGSWT